MNVVVLNGSPKSETSITLQYVYLLEKRFPEHRFEIVHIAQQIKRIEREETRFDQIVAQIRSADGVLWAFPLYYMLVHGGYKRFIELIWERGVEGAFAEKYTAALSTSIHFYDHTAHNYIHGICDDLEMHYVGAFSAEMQDLLNQEGQDLLVAFGKRFFSAIERQAPTQVLYAPVIHQEWDYGPGEGTHAVDVQGKKVVVLADLEQRQENLQQMVERFCASFAQEIEVINLREVDIKGGCLGCLQCGYDNQCVYADKAEYTQMHTNRLMTADVIVFAGAIHDRYLSALWKTFFDRSFYRGHAPSLIGKQIGVIVSGPLSQLANLRQVLTAWTEIQQSNLVGFVSDEEGDATALEAALAGLAENLVLCAVEGYIPPASFLGVGGQKLFRDDIWGRLRAVFQADHRAYKRLGVYDFPQCNWGTRVLNAVATVDFKFPKVREVVYGQMKEQMIGPYKRVIERG